MLKDNPHGTYWDIPGGRIERGHTVDETLRKEVIKETGITQVSDIEFFHAVIANIEIPTDQGNIGLALHIYKVRIPENTEIKLSNKHTEYKWAEINEAAELLKVKYPQEFTARLNRQG